MLTKLAALAAAAVLAVPAGAAALGAVAVTGSMSSVDCPVTAPVGLRGLDAEQAGNARLVVAVGQRLGVPDAGLVVALMAGMQESGLRDLGYGDRDSLRLFQQRPSAGWGTPAQILDPAYAAAAFYGGPHSPSRNPGLLDVPGWEELPPPEAAQAVQHSGFPDAYAQWETPARAWLGTINSDTCPVPASGAGAAVVIAAAARWLGTPYSWGGGDLQGPTLGIAQGAGTVGFDCSGLTRYAFAQVGVALPRTTGEQWLVPGQRIPTLSQLAAGDLVFFATDVRDAATIHHVAIWLGGDAMLESPRTGEFVQITRGISTSAYWAHQFIGGLRLLT